VQLALFDFDGTITTKDSLIDFIQFAVGKPRFYLGMALQLPMLVLFKLKLIPNYRAKEWMLGYYFKGLRSDDFHALAKEYSLEHINNIVREKARKKLTWHQEQGHKVVIVSASLHDWIQPWCEQEGFELIATRYAVENGYMSGKFEGKNCHGQEKVARIKAQLSLDEFSHIVAYGDSSGDKPMLALAHEAHYKPFRD